MIEGNIHTLKTAKLFNGINASELKAMLNCLNVLIREYNKNEYIGLAEEKFNSIGVLVKGSAALIKEDINGNRVIMTLLKPGDIFGEMSVFSSKPVWLTNVYVQEKCKVCFVPSAKIITACSNTCRCHTILIQNLLRTISEKALMLDQKVEYLTIKSMRGRICAFLFDQYKSTRETNIILQMNRNELADFLNVSRSSMSREMCKMRDEGIIDFHKSNFKILNVEALKDGKFQN